MPWKPHPLTEGDSLWGTALRQPFARMPAASQGAIPAEVAPESGLVAPPGAAPIQASWEPISFDVSDGAPLEEENGDPNGWSVLALMTALRGWISRRGSGPLDRPLPGQPGQDVIGDLKAAMAQERIVLRYFTANVNLELRNRPDPASRNWLSLPPRTTVFWRGQIGYDDATGQPWYLVYRIHGGTLYSGWVPASYLHPLTPEPISENPTAPENPLPAAVDQPSIVDELEVLWRKLLTDDERAAYYLPWRAMQAEIERLTGWGDPAVTTPPALAVEVERLLHPIWMTNGAPPPSFYGSYGPYPITEEIRLTLRRLVFHLYQVDGLLAVETWEILGLAFGISPADAFLQVLRPGLWNQAFPATTQAGLPLMMSVLPASGVYLREHPGVPRNLNWAPFNGIPQGDEVVVTGDYHILTDIAAQAQVLLRVDYTYVNARTYTGWVPAEMLGTRMVSLTPDVILWEGPVNTLGYRLGVEPWEVAGYHTYGQAQFLNLRSIFRILGWENWMAFAARHLNLCGLLALMEALNVSLEEGFRVFASIEGYEAILRDPDMGTTAFHLQRFAQSLGWEAEVHHGSNDLTPYLHDHQVVLALVASVNGRVSRRGTSGHWVHVLEVDDESRTVTIYNPLPNEAEELSLSEFNAAWGATRAAGISSQDYILLSAHP